MSKPPSRYRSSNPREAAEAAFRTATTRFDEAASVPKAPTALPAAKEMVSLRLDRDVLEHFQADGAGWQERINAALRQAARLA